MKIESVIINKLKDRLITTGIDYSGGRKPRYPISVVGTGVGVGFSVGFGVGFSPVGAA